jgi:hypothetical protein
MFSSKYRFVLLLSASIAAVAFAAQSAPPKAATTVAAANGLDAAAKAKLVGEHRLTLQWLGWSDLSKAGNVTIKDGRKTLSVEGEQIGVGENAGDYLRISGKIVAASKNGFVFEGDIVTRVHHNANGEECKRSGRFNFATKSGRKYWRLQEMDSPCDSVTDYVDIYFRGI